MNNCASSGMHVIRAHLAEDFEVLPSYMVIECSTTCAKLH